MSYLLTFVYIYPLLFLAHSAVCSQMSCSSCLSNNDIQTRDQISVPCTMPYFHKDTLTPPSSSRSPTLEGGRHGPSTYAARNASLYNARSLLRDLHLALESIQLMSITGYETFVCVCFFVMCSPSYGFCGTPVVACMCVYTKRKNCYINYKKYCHKNEKHLENEQKVGILQKMVYTRGVGITNMRKSIYLLTTTPIDSTHTHLLLTKPIDSIHSH